MTNFKVISLKIEKKINLLPWLYILFRCYFDYLTISDRFYKNFYTFCGQENQSSPILITDSVAIIKFVSDDGNQGKGFQLTYKSRPINRNIDYNQCGQAPELPFENKKTRIIGGLESIPGQWPWMVSIWEGQKFICGGTLIKSQWVLTAAHCFKKPIKRNNWAVMYGVYYLNWINRNEKYVSQILDILIHPYYGKRHSYDYDFALIKLESIIKFEQMIRPICIDSMLQVNRNEMNNYSHCYTAGWGRSEDSSTSNELRHLKVPILNLTSCNQTKAYHGKLTDAMLCAGYMSGGKDSCKGDSGGPLMCQLQSKHIWYQIGVISFGKDCAVTKQPGIYANLTLAYEWIQYEINHG